MINNPYLQQLQTKSPLGMLILAIRNGLEFSKGAIIPMLISAWKMKKANGMTLGETMMAGNAPMMIQEAMVKGHPDQGILPSGQIAGAIKDLPKGSELIASIVSEATETLTRLSRLSGVETKSGNKENSEGITATT